MKLVSAMSILFLCHSQKLGNWKRGGGGGGNERGEVKYLKAFFIKRSDWVRVREREREKRVKETCR